MAEYYYVKGEERFGPFSLEQLKNENIQPSDLIWREGFEDWMMASEVEEVKGFFKVAPPPIPKNTPDKVEKIAEKKVEPPKVEPAKINPPEKTVQPKSGTKPSASQLPVGEKKWNQLAFVLTLAFIAFKLFICFALPDVINLLISVGFMLGIWILLRKNIIVRGEFRTGKRTFWIMGAFIIYGIMNLVYIIGGKSFGGSGDDYLTVPFICLTVASVFVIITAINVMNASKRLGGVCVFIGLATIFTVPTYLFFSTLGFLPDSFTLIKDEDRFGLFLMLNSQFMISFYFIAFYFYKSWR